MKVQSIQERPGRPKPYLVRWTVGGKAFSEGFPTKTQADDLRSRLVIAARDHARWNSKTGYPKAWDASSDLDVAGWCKQYVEQEWTTLTPNSRRSLVESLTLLIDRAASTRAPILTPEQRKQISVWLVPGSDSLAAPLAKWVARWSLSLDELEKSELYRIEKLLRLGVDRKTALSSRTANRHCSTAKRCLTEALAAGALSELEWPEAQSSGAKRTATKRVSWDDTKAINRGQLRTIADAMPNKQPASFMYRVMTIIAGEAGLRPGEVVALNAEDIHFASEGWGHITVMRAWKAAGIYSDADPIGTTKTAVSRTVPMSLWLASELKMWIEMSERFSGPLFLTNGKRPQQSNWTRALKRACTKVNVEPISPYALRHSYASRLSLSGMDPASAAARMGHSVEVYFRCYVKPVGDQTDAGNALLEEMEGWEEN